MLPFLKDESALVTIAAKDAIKRLDKINPKPGDATKRLPYEL